MTVGLADAQTRRLPPVCVITGQPAAGFVPVVIRARFRRLTVLLPLSSIAFARWERMEHMRMRAPVAATGFGLAGAVLLLKGGVYAAPLLLAAVVAFGAYWYATMRSPWRLPTVVRRNRTEVDVLGVHDGFASAIAAGRVPR